ncbi:type II toxin-antitoxin system RelE/ParE family toxin [Aliivibrio wodanis]|uniref:type II toxin-antitoxin system RelE/ParE family toxin n=1 Tax=Aliivibrio wodanis TaxID=80852 RepID=UPI00406C2AF0
MKIQEVQINVTDTFEQTVESSITHLTPWSSEELVINKVEKLIDDFQEQVTSNPFIYPRCAELAEYGSSNIREFKRNDFRLLYEITQETEDLVVIDMLLLLRQKQSIQNQLIEHCLFYK